MIFGGREKATTLEVRDVPVLPDDEHEVRERLGFKKGLIALDIVFDQSGTPFVLEIQGMDAGVDGIAKDLIDDGCIPSEVKKFAQNFMKNESGHANPRWFEDVADRKDEQLAFIPEAHRPRSVVNDDFDTLFETGKVIIKPLRGAKGIGIRIFDATQKTEARAYAAKLHKNLGGFVAQSFIEPSGAELAAERLQQHAASLRLFIPFEMIDGRPVITQHGIGYQRIAPEPMPDFPSDDVGYDRAGVVNRSRGAHSAPMSETEYNKALPVALAVLENLITRPEESEEYQERLKWHLERQVYEVWSKVNKILPNRIFLMMRVHGFESLQQVRGAIYFLRFLEREISFLNQEDVANLEKRRVLVTISYSPELGGNMEYSFWKTLGNVEGDEEFSASDDNLFILTRVVEDLARGRRPGG